MRPKHNNLDKKDSETARETVKAIREISAEPGSRNADVRYVNQNRDRALGETDRTGRHFDEAEPNGEAKKE